jgi:hypothetical protein
MQAATRTELGQSKPPHLDKNMQVYTGITTISHPLGPAASGVRRAVTLFHFQVCQDVYLDSFPPILFEMP